MVPVNAERYLVSSIEANADKDLQVPQLKLRLSHSDGVFLQSSIDFLQCIRQSFALGHVGHGKISKPPDGGFHGRPIDLESKAGPLPVMISVRLEAPR
jgi:hypothetical protein